MKSKKIGKSEWKLMSLGQTIYPTSLIWLMFSVALTIFANLAKNIDISIKSIVTSISTGIIASAVVAIFIQRKQDRIIYERKKSILFDAFFWLDTFIKKYSNTKGKKEGIDWIDKYKSCEETAKYLSDLYNYNKEIFDTAEIVFLRNISTRMFFLLSISPYDNEIFTSYMEEEGKVREVNETCEMLVNEIINNIIKLIIKWNMDGMMNIDLDKSEIWKK